MAFFRSSEEREALRLAKRAAADEARRRVLQAKVDTIYQREIDKADKTAASIRQGGFWAFMKRTGFRVIGIGYLVVLALGAFSLGGDSTAIGVIALIGAAYLGRRFLRL